jgi:hypothetical protein
MSDTLDLDEVEARANAATEGPWRALTSGRRGGDHWHVTDSDQSIALIHASDGEDEDMREPDAEFIAHARTDVPALVAEVRRLRAKVVAVEQAGTVVIEAIEAERTALRGALERVLALHTKYTGAPWCRACGLHWPCATRQTAVGDGAQ